MRRSIDPADATSEVYLRRISNLLKIPIAEFFDADNRQSDESELLRLWQAIHHDADRARALDMLRAMVVAQDHRDAASTWPQGVSTNAPGNT